jgi:Fe2+ transport system protein FeoA
MSKTFEVRLGELNPGDFGTILRVERDSEYHIEDRLFDLGVLEGEEVFVRHQAPLGGDPIAIEIRGMLLGLRREEANLVWIKKGDSK